MPILHLTKAAFIFYGLCQTLPKWNISIFRSLNKVASIKLQQWSCYTAIFALPLAAACFAAFCCIICSAVCRLATVSISAAPASSNFCASEIPRFSAAWSDLAQAVSGAATMAAYGWSDQVFCKHTLQAQMNCTEFSELLIVTRRVAIIR